MQDYTTLGYPLMAGLLFLLSSLMLVFHTYGNRKYYFWLFAIYFYLESGVYIVLTFYTFKTVLHPFVPSDDFLRTTAINIRFLLIIPIVLLIVLIIRDTLYYKKGLKRK